MIWSENLTGCNKNADACGMVAVLHTALDVTMSREPKSVLDGARPEVFRGRGDKYLGEIAQDLSRLLRKTAHGFARPECRLPEPAWNEIAPLIVEWAEDVHSDLKLWATVEGYQKDCLGTPLPLVVARGQGEEVRGFDPRRIQFLLWNLWPFFNPGHVISPGNADFMKLSKTGANFVAERF